PFVGFIAVRVAALARRRPPIVVAALAADATLPIAAGPTPPARIPFVVPIVAALAVANLVAACVPAGAPRRPPVLPTTLAAYTVVPVGDLVRTVRRTHRLV